VSNQRCEACPNPDCSAGGRTSWPNGSCCGNYETVSNFATSFVKELANGATAAVVQFGHDATLSYATGSTTGAINAINNSPYTGGYTHTEAAIDMCVGQLKGSQNPVIVLITDGSPTACKKNDGNNINTGNSNCDKTNCNACKHGNNAQKAAEHAANEAAKNNMSLIPVVISSVKTDKDNNYALARCPENPTTPCNVNDYKGLHVGKIEDVDQILDQLVLTTNGCAPSGGNETPGSESGGTPGSSENPCDTNVCDACPRKGHYTSDDGSTYCCVGEKECKGKEKNLNTRNLCCSGKEACYEGKFSADHPIFTSVQCKGEAACRKVNFGSYNGGTGPVGICCDGKKACNELGKNGGVPGGSRVQCGLGSSQKDSNKEVCYKSKFDHGSTGVCCSGGKDACKKLCDSHNCSCRDSDLSWCSGGDSSGGNKVCSN